MPAMFSNRTSWNRTTNRVAQALERRRAAGLVVSDLTESNPTNAGLGPPPDILETLTEAGGLRYEPDSRGWLGAREAVARDYARRGVTVDAERLLLTASTSEAYAYLFKLLCDPGDRIVVPRPSYPLFEYLAALESVNVDHCKLAYDGEWHLDFASLEAALTPRTRAVVVVHPNNPTGAYLKPAEVERLQALCARNTVALVSDEVFADYALGARPARVSLASDGPALTFALGGLSKSCGLPQLKLGWMAVSGPVAARDEALARLELVADTYLSVATPVQRAAPALLARLPELQTPIRERAATNLAALRRALTAHVPLTLWPPEGGWNAVLRIPATLPEERRVLRLLERDGVLVHPGFFFDFEAEAFLVLSLLPDPTVFAHAVERIVADAEAE
jgi:alanine-synthesizing transaminase